MEAKKVCLGIVKDCLEDLTATNSDDCYRPVRQAASNMYHNPQANFDRGVAAMIQAYKEIGPFDYVAVIGEAGLADIVLSSHNFFEQEVAENFKAAGIDVAVEGIGATTGGFWGKEITEPLVKNAEIGIGGMERKSCQISQGKSYRYHFDAFNYDRNVVVYKLVQK